jgi:integrase
LLAGAATRRVESTSAPTFAQVCEEWLQHGERERRLKPSTLIDYRAAVSARLIPALGFLPVDQVTPQLLEAWRDALLDEATISHRTINKLLMIVGAALERARRRELIDDNPARRLDKLKERAYDDLEFYEPDEIWLLVATAASDQDGVIFLLLAFSGLRGGEALALTRRDVDFKRQEVAPPRECRRLLPILGAANPGA